MNKYHTVGYVVKEALTSVHDALRRSEITSVEFKWIKYVSDWYRSGPGYFAGINVTKVGTWPPSVMWVSSTRCLQYDALTTYMLCKGCVFIFGFQYIAFCIVHLFSVCMSISLQLFMYVCSTIVFKFITRQL